jgi:hypothetical protein
MKAVLGIGFVALVAVAVFALDVPSRIADLGSGNLDRLVAPTTTVSFGAPVKLEGRRERPPVVVTATRTVPVRSATKGVRAAKGHVLVGLPLTIHNVGPTPFEVSTGIQATAGDSKGLSYRPAQDVLRVRGRPVIRISRVRPQGQLRGVVVFEVPRGTTLTTARFTVGSGLTRTAEWTTKAD